MGIIINLDGTDTEFSHSIDEQQILANELSGWEISDKEAMLQLRKQRDQLLLECDWTQGVDSPLDSTTKTAWATYRQKLRDLTSLENAPSHLLDSEWPLAPGQSELPEESYEFMRKNLDPVGLGTTSWVGQRTEILELNGPPVYKNTPSTRKTIIFEAPLDTISGGTVSIGDTFAYNGESSTITGVAATSITLATGIGATISIGTTGTFLHQETRYFAQDKPLLKSSVSAASTVVGVGSTVVVTLSTINQASAISIVYKINGYQYDGLILDNKANGNFIIEPDPVTHIGVSTLTIGLSTDISNYYRDDGLSITFDGIDYDGHLGIFVGITTT